MDAANELIVIDLLPMVVVMVVASMLSLAVALGSVMIDL